MFERVENRGYITWISRSNPVRSIRIVNGRLSIRCVVGDLGFCDLDSPDIFKRAIGTILVARRMVLIDDAVVIKLGLQAIRSAMLLTKLN